VEALGRVVLIAGICLAAIGVGLLVMGRLGVTWRPLPGDLIIRRPGMVVAIPLVTMLLLSLVLTLLLNFIAWVRR
jgi:hypothetical protein